jgi:2,3-bisphosphoglycerate-independent phosphoglycerate mutase
LHICLADLKLPSFPEHRVGVQYATEHRCGVVLSGPNLSDSISGTDPLRDNLPLQVGSMPAMSNVWSHVRCEGGLDELGVSTDCFGILR